MNPDASTFLTGNLIAASAGTGKTYQLTSRYLALLALGAKPEKMIALTFTKKAAGEFRNRIFQALAEAALDKKDRDTPSRNAAAVRVWETWTGLHINEDWTLTPASNPVALFPAAIPMLKRAAARHCYPEQLNPEATEPALPQLTADFFADLLIRVLSKASELQLSTLDSFFNRVVAADTHRAGLSSVTPMNPLQQQRATRTALQAMLAESEKSRHHESALITLLTCIADEKGGALLDILERNINTYLSLYKEFPQEQPWGKTAPFMLPDCLDTPLLTEEDIIQYQQQIDEDVARLSWKKPRSYVKKTFATVANKLKTGEFSMSQSFTAWFSGDDKYLAPTEELAIDDRLRNTIRQLKYQCSCIFLRGVQERSAAMFELLKKYYTAYRDSILSAGLCTFDDIKQGARTLLGSNSDGEESGMALSLTTKLDHWMLDEFQDTDPVQWEILSPLLKENAQYPEKTLFVVGDKKQSIYSFRGASSELFEQLRGTKSSEDGYDWQARVLTNSSLSESRRSAPAIMEFTNMVFSPIEETDEEFSLHRTHSGNQDKQGYVKVTALPKSNAAQTLEDACLAIGRILDELTEPTSTPQRRLKNGISVAILLRQGNAARNIVAWLRRYKPEIPVQLVEDTPLTEASPLGELLLSFFIWLKEPADKYRYNVLRVSPLGSMMHTEAAGGTDATQNTAWDAWMNLLNERGYAHVIQRLAKHLPQLSSTRMLNEWLEEAVQFDAAGGSLEEWILHMRTCCRKENGSAQFIQVMTMHKSKGAEFDAVILPFLGSKAVDQPRAEGIPYFISDDKNGLLIHPGTATERSNWQPLVRCEEQWKRARRDDSYNLMYVALTRARFANYILLPGGGELPETPNKEADWILQAILQQGLEISADKDAEFGHKNWYAQRPLTSSETATKQPAQPLGKVCAPRQRISPSAMMGEPRKGEDKQFSTESNTGTDFGTAVHECFEEILWLQEKQPTWLKSPVSEAQQVVAAALQQDEIQALFIQKTGQEVYNEQSVEAINDKNEWISASIDRLVLTHDASGQVVAAHIIDFKTNKPVPHDGYKKFEDWLIDHYTGQMREYRKLICSAFNLPVGAVRVSLISCPKEGKAKVLTYTEEKLQDKSDS